MNYNLKMHMMLQDQVSNKSSDRPETPQQLITEQLTDIESDNTNYNSTTTDDAEEKTDGDKDTEETDQTTDGQTTDCNEMDALYVNEDNLIELQVFDDHINDNGEDDDHDDVDDINININDEAVQIAYNGIMNNNNNHSVHSYEIESKQLEIDRSLEILSDLPFYKLPLSDSFRKYDDRYFKAIHIFNKYLSSEAFDSLNISQHSLTDIETQLRALYEYKLKSYNIGLHLNETEKLQQSLKLDSRYSRSTNFDFFEEPEENIFDNNNNHKNNNNNNNNKLLPKIKIHNTYSNASTISSSTTNTISSINSIPSSITLSQSQSSAATSPYTQSFQQQQQHQITLDILKSKLFDHNNTNNNNNNDEQQQEIKQKRKLRDRLGLEIHFNTNEIFIDQTPKIQNDDEFVEKLLNVFDICLPDVLHNLESALTRFKTTKEYCWALADKLNHQKQM